MPLYCLDQYYWNPGWQRVESQKFDRIHRELCDKDTWIIEGVGQSVWQYRFEKADTIIFLDTPRYICMWRVIKRSLYNWGSVIPGDPEGCKQQIFNVKFFNFLQWVWNFNIKYKPRIEDIIQNLDQSKKNIFSNLKKI